MELLITGHQTLFEEDAFFMPSTITKSDGSKREIWIPNYEMREIHKFMLWELKTLRDQLSPAATGSLEDCSPAKNVEAHAGNRYFYQLDFKDAYSQVDAEILATILASIQYGKVTEQDVADTVKIFKKFCFLPESEYDQECIGQGVLFGEELKPNGDDLGYPKGLVTGAPTSPFLFNLYCLPLDEVLSHFCDKKGITYTRYLDDLTFSSSSENGAISAPIRHKIREIIGYHQFELNAKKTRVSDIYKAPVIITGLQLNKHGNWQITERYVRATYKRLYDLAMTRGVTDAETFNLAAGYKGLLLSSTDKKRARPAPSEARLLDLVNSILPEKIDESADDWYNPDFM